MKFKSFLQEEVIRPNRVYIKRIVNKLDNHIKSYIRSYNGKVNLHLNDIEGFVNRTKIENVSFKVPDNWRFGASFSKFIINATGGDNVNFFLSGKFCNLIKDVIDANAKTDRTHLKKAERILDTFITENNLLGKSKCKEIYQQNIVDDIRNHFKLTDKHLIKKQYQIFDRRKKDITSSIPWDNVNEYVKNNWLKVIASNERRVETLDNDKDYRYFIDKDFPNVLTHEIIHVDQLIKNKTKQFTYSKKVLKKHKTNLYYHDKAEQMAHADSLLRQLKDEGYDNETIGKMLRQPKSYSEALMKSSSYRKFRDAIEDEKHWKQFMKYIYQYWQDKE